MHGLIIGAGQLGSRYLQGLAALEPLTRLYVVEPQEEARLRAAARFAEMPDHARIALEFTGFDTLETQKPLLDFAIIASTARDRLALLARALGLGVKHILCEKVAFQSVAHYDEALKITAQAQANVRIPHIMRYIPFYQRLRKAALSPLLMQVQGGDVGLGCNLIHYLDCFTFITGAALASLEVTLDAPPHANKRGAEYIEFTGRAEAATARGDRFSLAFTGTEPTAPVIRITGAGLDASVDESTNRWEDHAHGTEGALDFPRMSALAAHMVADMLRGDSILPTLRETAHTNRLMLAAFNNALYGAHDDARCCPIT